MRRAGLLLGEAFILTVENKHAFWNTKFGI